MVMASNLSSPSPSLDCISYTGTGDVNLH